MRIDRLWLCFPDMDRIVVDRLQDLGKFNLGNVKSIDVKLNMSVEDFLALRDLVEQNKKLAPR